MHRLLRRRQGLTLVELVVTMAIVAIVTIMIFGVYLFGVAMSNKGTNQSDVQRQARLAAQYITTEIRTANSVEILSSMPASPIMQKKYFYIEGNILKQYDLGTIRNILSVGSGFTPELVFDKNPDDEKVLDFTIECTYKGQNFGIESQVLALNIEPPETIQGLPGSVVSFSCPLTDSEIVMLDNAWLDLGVSNPFLIASGGSWILDPPPGPRSLTLPVAGFNGSAISWQTSDASVVKTDGTVIRPGIDAGDISVLLTAELTKGTVSQTKEFRVTVRDLDPLVLENTAVPAATVGAAYDYDFSASGGDASYTFTTSDPLYGLVLGTNGHLSGTPDAGASDFSFNLTVRDGYDPDLDGHTNELTETVNLAVAH